ncbi:MAG: HEAT repeat domain-containing protein [Cyanobacteria bacterium P01_F01_bin.53]
MLVETLMTSPFANMLGLTEEEAIALLDAPSDQIGDGNSRYAAAAHLINFSSERTIQALIRAIHNRDETLDNRIVRRKAVESLGRLKAKSALSVIQSCLQEDDCYTVENAVWAIGEIGTDNVSILEDIAQLLAKPNQTYRVIIQTLARLGYRDSISRIQPFIEHEEGPIASAAIAAIARLRDDRKLLDRILPFLEHTDVYTRRLCIQDLMDAKHYSSIPAIVRCPVSFVFRLRGIRALLETGLESECLKFQDIQGNLENVLKDHPSTLSLVHEYDQPPTLEFLIRELYETDFGRCYLATQTLIADHQELAPNALTQTYVQEAYDDYGANYHVIKTLGWLKHKPAYSLFVNALHREEPQFQKSQIAAAVALGELGNSDAVPELQRCLSSPIWSLRYTVLMALEKLGGQHIWEQATQDLDLLLQKRAVLST